MHRKSQGRARSSEEVGKRIAGEMSDFFSVSLGRETAEDQLRKRLAKTIAGLRTALYEAVDGFNGQAPWDYHLAVLNRGDRMLFNSFGQFTLTVTFGDDQVLIHPYSESAKSQTPFVVDILRIDGALRYRAEGPRLEPPVFEDAFLTELQFVDSVIRMACNRKLERQAAC